METHTRACADPNPVGSGAMCDGESVEQGDGTGELVFTGLI